MEWTTDDSTLFLCPDIFDNALAPIWDSCTDDDVMDRILNRICVIPDHPVAKLDEIFRIIYVKGLGACLYEMSNGAEITKMFFDAWSSSILQHTTLDSDLWRKNPDAIRNAIAIHREGFRFFSMKYHLFYDVFYLLSCGKGENLKETFVYDDAQVFLKPFCGLLTRHALKNTYLHFKEGKGCPKLAPALLCHKEKNESILCQKEKRILVVANVSAGKSTLINAIMGHRLNRTMNRACTNKIVTLRNKVEKDGMTVRLNKGRYAYFKRFDTINSNDFVDASLPFNSLLSESHICLIDTPGINNSEDQQHRQITEKAIKENKYDAIIYVSNSLYFGTYDERRLLEMLKKSTSKPIFFVLNQLDRFKKKEDSIEKMVSDYKSDLKKIGFRCPKVFPVSAQAALLKKLNPDEMDEEDAEDRQMFERKFKQDYYNLPSYVGEVYSDTTGLELLEDKIRKEITTK